MALAAWLTIPLVEDRLLALGELQLRARYGATTRYRSLDYYLARLPLIIAAVRSALLWAGAIGAVLAIGLWQRARLGGRVFAGHEALEEVERRFGQLTGADANGALDAERPPGGVRGKTARQQGNEERIPL